MVSSWWSRGVTLVFCMLVVMGCGDDDDPAASGSATGSGASGATGGQGPGGGGGAGGAGAGGAGGLPWETCYDTLECATVDVPEGRVF